MKIDTNLVKEKKFGSAIKSEIQNTSQEYKVLAILRYLYPQYFSTMLKKEAPDLQDDEKSIGIEVVSVSDEMDMKANRAFSDLSLTIDKDKKSLKIRFMRAVTIL